MPRQGMRARLPPTCISPQAQYVMTDGATHSNFLDDRAAFEQALALLKTVVTTDEEQADVARLTAAYATFKARRREDLLGASPG